MTMTVAEFARLVEIAHAETHDALAKVWGELNHGQRQKLLKNEDVAKVLRRYRVIE